MPPMLVPKIFGTSAGGVIMTLISPKKMSKIEITQKVDHVYE